ncbi:MAG: glycerol-3-phosphate acyltransferase [Bacteroidota bacterium]
MGHIFPVFAGFRGGKGVHVSLGVLLAVQPVATIAIATLTLIIFLVSRYPVLGYLVGALTLPIFVLATPSLQGDMRLPMLMFSILIFGMLLYSHRENLQLILQGREHRVPLHWH